MKNIQNNRFISAYHVVPKGIAFIIICVAAAGPIHAQKRELPIGVTFKNETIKRKGFYGDNWCQTWAADDNIYTMLDDGNGWWGSAVKKKGDFDGWDNSMLIRIKGGSDFTDQDVTKVEGYPKNPITGSFYAYGTVSVSGTLYVWLWKSESQKWYKRPIANRLLYSSDQGKTFHRWNGIKETSESFSDTDSSSFFFYKEDPRHHIDRDSYAFNWLTFCQNGKDNSAAKDEFVYMYGPEQHEPRNLVAIRVHKDSILDKTKYQYFKGFKGKNAEWTRDMKLRGVNLQYPKSETGKEWMWASWFPDVVYNAGLDLYMMVSYGIKDDNKKFWDGWCQNCKYPASLGFWYSENPWGPWKQIYYTENFYADRPENRTYGFKLNPKWISKDGKTMTLIWSDAGDDHSTNYKWNQMEITIQTATK